MTGRAAGYDRNMNTLANRFQGIGANGQPVFKIDQRYADLITKQIDVMKKLNESYLTALSGGKTDEAMSLSTQLGEQQRNFDKLVEKATGTGAEDKKKDDVVRGIGFNQVTGMLSQALETIIHARDRTAIMQAYGSGDAIGGQYAEFERGANIAHGVGGLLKSSGGIAAMFGGPFGMVAGGILSGTGIAVDLITKWIEAGEKNKAVGAQLWDQASPNAMQLAALTGDPNNIRPSFARAAKMGAEWGYSADETMASLKEAAYQGLDGSVVSEILTQERSTGADRGVLSSLGMMSERYGQGNALKYGWAGLQASGMKTGQYSEYLRGMEKILSDGVAKGFVRAEPEITRSLAMISQVGGGSELFKGEGGARILQGLDAGSAGATGLQSANDILMYQAFKEAMPKGSSVTDIRAAMEKGFSNNPLALARYDKLLRENVGYDNEDAYVAAFEKARLGINVGQRFFKSGGNLKPLDAFKLLNSAEGLPSLKSTEFDFQKEVQIRANQVIIEGQKYYDEVAHKLIGGRIEDETLAEIRNDPNNSKGTNENVAYEYAHIQDKYFRGEGDPLSDTTAFEQFSKMIRDASDSDKHKILSNLNSRETSLNARDMDRYDMLNSILSDNTNASVFLAKLDQMIRLLEEGNDEEKIIEIINKG
jgi:hypothetical protein